MNFRERCQVVNRIDIVDYLSSIGYEPAKPPRGHNYWYLSMLPGRFESTPSFKVNRNRNKWHDFGLDMKKGEGSLIDFGLRYYKCTIPEFLDMLSSPLSDVKCVPRQSSSIGKEPEHKIIILEDNPIQSFPLIQYLRSRRIPLDVAQKYCREIRFKFKDKSYYAIGHKNDRGGYELRNEYFKGGSSPKGITFIDNGAEDVTTFEGQFNLLSYETIYKNQEFPPTNYLLLNGTAFAKKAFSILEKHRYKYLYWDRGKGGREITQMALSWGPSYIDKSDLYKGYDDLNEWHCKIGPSPDKHLSFHRHRKLHI